MWSCLFAFVKILKQSYTPNVISEALLTDSCWNPGILFEKKRNKKFFPFPNSQVEVKFYQHF